MDRLSDGLIHSFRLRKRLTHAGGLRLCSTMSSRGYRSDSCSTVTTVWKPRLKKIGSRVQNHLKHQTQTTSRTLSLGAPKRRPPAPARLSASPEILHLMLNQVSADPTGSRRTRPVKDTFGRCGSRAPARTPARTCCEKSSSSAEDCEIEPPAQV